MPEDGRMNLAAVVPPPDQSAGRDRPSLVGFLTDRETDEALRKRRSHQRNPTNLRRGGIKRGDRALRKPPPRAC